jgi:hypothetical protein
MARTKIGRLSAECCAKCGNVKICCTCKPPVTPQDTFLPVGARKLPTGETESLSARLQFIRDEIEDDIHPTVSNRLSLLDELIAEVKARE